MPNDPTWNQRLSDILTEFDCQTGTIDRTLPDGKTLEILAFIGIPEFLIDKISMIPFGKGIAGVAAEQRKPVELCNLQQDLGGVAKPDARQTKVSGSLAVPIFDPKSQSVTGTLGIGMMTPHDFSPEETQRLEQHAATIAGIFEQNPL